MPAVTLVTDDTIRKHTTDRYGRALIGLSFGSRLNVTAEPHGYFAETRTIECTRKKPDIEEVVQVRSASKQKQD